MTAPVFSQVNLVVSDMDATLAFYRSLGLAFDDHAGAVWPPGTGARHAEAVLDGGPVLEFDIVEMAGLWHRAHRESDVRGAPRRVVLGFAVPTRSEVDERYATPTTATAASGNPTTPSGVAGTRWSRTRTATSAGS